MSVFPFPGILVAKFVLWLFCREHHLPDWDGELVFLLVALAVGLVLMIVPILGIAFWHWGTVMVSTP